MTHMEWISDVLLPLAEKLSNHKMQSYSGDLNKSKHQAAIRLLAGSKSDQRHANKFLLNFNF